MAHAFKIGDRVDGWGNEGIVIGCDDEGDRIQVLWDGEADEQAAGDLRLLGASHLSLTDEVQDLINILVSTGNDSKRLLSRRVAQLMSGTRGALSRSDKMQAAAMLLVSAGSAADYEPEDDDG